MKRITGRRLVFVSWGFIAMTWILDITMLVLRKLGYPELVSKVFYLILICLFVAICLVVWMAGQSLIRTWGKRNGRD